MLYEWLNRSHIVEWWRRRSTPTLADVQEQYLPSVLAQESVITPYIVMLNGEPIGYAQSYVALEAGTDGKEETDPGVRGNRPVTGECITPGQRLGNCWFEPIELLFNDPEVTKIQTDLSPSNLRERSDATRKRGLRGKVP